MNLRIVNWFHRLLVFVPLSIVIGCAAFPLKENQNDKFLSIDSYQVVHDKNDGRFARVDFKGKIRGVTLTKNDTPLENQIIKVDCRSDSDNWISPALYYVRLNWKDSDNGEKIISDCNGNIEIPISKSFYCEIANNDNNYSFPLTFSLGSLEGYSVEPDKFVINMNYYDGYLSLSNVPIKVNIMPYSRSKEYKIYLDQQKQIAETIRKQGYYMCNEEVSDYLDRQGNMIGEPIKDRHYFYRLGAMQVIQKIENGYLLKAYNGAVIFLITEKEFPINHRFHARGNTAGQWSGSYVIYNGKYKYTALDGYEHSIYSFKYMGEN
jgi:hypothetical protein